MSAPWKNNTSTKPHVICGTCHELIAVVLARFGSSREVKEVDLPEMFPILGRYSVHEVQESGLRGCHICSFISQAVCPAHSERDIRHIPGSQIIIKPNYVYTKPRQANILCMDTLQVQLVDSHGKMVEKDSLLITSAYETYSRDPVPASWSISTGSDASIELAREWLHHCLSHHELCKDINATPVSTNKNTLPAYFVDVESDNPRLCRSKNIPIRPEYLTLSHRWGKSSILQLTTKNLASLLSEIPLSSLPKTFQDAILITRRLGYRYIWIDSLCIIQDSREHWEQESAIMGDVYGHSVCTIAALGATNGDSGCFKSRNPLCFQLCEFELGPGQVVYLMPPRKQGSSPEHTGYGPNVEPLHERAWVIQEWMLSPRTIHYGTFGLFWECATETANDRAPRKIAFTSRPSPKYAVHQACTLPRTGALDHTFLGFWHMWERVVSIYSPCSLTYNTDKLVAINGIVTLIESKAGLHNVAGLWKEYILPELLWTVQPPTQPAGTYQAPTWSWASLNCNVILGVLSSEYTYDGKIDLLDIVVQPAAANGQILYAHIRVRGLLQPVSWAQDEDSDTYELRWGDNIGTKGSTGSRDLVAFLPDIEPDPEKEMWALLVMRAASNTSWMNLGLVLSKKDPEGDIWVRVGAFRQYDFQTETTDFFCDGDAELMELDIV
ncbi:heterokaryon incompatibility protein-domain-containing protein [Collybia nuda]|uniref:Heterokaryon incompatibility protein-domain-containing protein n=1 Tax=Collybia nuda TaxID=64659 RepID=A0A9P5XUX8_9AGAR|nr:heterokaryon incompatibility protein-domain-containing protein [Collybia nuda]